MNLRTFIASSMPEALAKVRKELGADAVILHTRMVTRRGGFLKMFSKPMVEITAADKALVAKYRQGRKGAGAEKRAGGVERGGKMVRGGAGEMRSPTTGGQGRAPAGGQGSLVQQPTAGDLIRKTYAAAWTEFEKKQQKDSGAAAVKSPPTPPTVPPTIFPAVSPVVSPVVSSGSASVAAGVQGGMSAGVSGGTSGAAAAVVVPIGPAQEQLTREMQAVQRMVGKMMLLQRQQAGGGDGVGSDIGDGLSGVLMDQYLGLIKQEVAEELAEEIVGKVRKQMPADAMLDSAVVRATMLKTVAELIPTDSGSWEGLGVEGMKGGVKKKKVGPRRIALVGPTGVGKTTTVAKLAAIFKLRKKMKVGLVTLDTYRIAAVEQLKTYAQIIGVPLVVVSSEQEMRDANLKYGDCDVVLIDTAGRSQRDDPKLLELGQMLRAAEPDEVHLVLSSTANQGVLLEAVERFSSIRTDRIIFTKLDEAVSFGVLLNVARKVNKKLSFVTTGQEVPQHIESGKAERLAALVLGEGV